MKKYMFFEKNSAGETQKVTLSENEIHFVTYSTNASEEENKKAFEEYIAKLGAVSFSDTSLHAFQESVGAFLEANPEEKFKASDLLLVDRNDIPKIISDCLWGMANLAIFFDLSLSELADLAVSTHTAPK